MSRFGSAAGSAQQPGGGALLRIDWPNGADQFGNTNSWQRFNSQSTGAAQTVALAGGTITAPVVQLGRAAARLNATAAGPTGSGMGFTIKPQFMTERAGGAQQTDGLCCCFRADIAMDALVAPLGAKDFGITLLMGSRSNPPQRANQAGVTLGPTDANSVKIRAKAADGGANTIDQLVTGGATLDVTKWHCYQFNCVSGSSTTDPFLQAFIDGIPVTQKFSWTAASALLPPLTVAVGFPFFEFWVHNASDINSSLYLGGMSITVARTEADLF